MWSEGSGSFRGRDGIDRLGRGGERAPEECAYSVRGCVNSALAAVADGSEVSCWLKGGPYGPSGLGKTQSPGSGCREHTEGGNGACHSGYAPGSPSSAPPPVRRRGSSQPSLHLCSLCFINHGTRVIFPKTKNIIGLFGGHLGIVATFYMMILLPL